MLSVRCHISTRRQEPKRDQQTLQPPSTKHEYARLHKPHTSAWADTASQHKRDVRPLHSCCAPHRCETTGSCLYGPVDLGVSTPLETPLTAILAAVSILPKPGCHFPLVISMCKQLSSSMHRQHRQPLQCQEVCKQGWSGLLELICPYHLQESNHGRVLFSEWGWASLASQAYASRETFPLSYCWYGSTIFMSLSALSFGWNWWKGWNSQ